MDEIWGDTRPLSVPFFVPQELILTAKQAQLVDTRGHSERKEPFVGKIMGYNGSSISGV